MRDLFVIIVILGTIFGGNYFINKHVEESGNKFLNMVKKLEEGIESDSGDTKNKEVKKILDVWEDNEKKWIMIGYHQEINQIEDLVIECYSYYLQGDKDLFEVSYRKLERNIEDMKNREIITFTNIL